MTRHTESLGAYNLVAEHEGFKKYVEWGIALQMDQTARLDLTLELGALSESVQVAAEALLLNADTGSKGQVIDNREIVDLPLNGRDFNELAYLTPTTIVFMLAST